MKLINVKPIPVSRPPVVYVIELTEGDLLHMARLSYTNEAGPEFPKGRAVAGERRLFEKVAHIAPHINPEEPITPDQTV